VGIFPGAVFAFSNGSERETLRGGWTGAGGYLTHTDQENFGVWQ